MLGNITLLASCCFAGISATAFGYCWTNKRIHRQRREQLLEHSKAERKKYLQGRLACEGIAASLIGRLKIQKQKQPIDNQQHVMFGYLLQKSLQSYEKLSNQAGLAASVSPYSYGTFRIKMSIAGMLCGALLGSMFSVPLLWIGGCVGLVLGWRSVPWAFKQEIKARKNGLEKQLSEMMEVVSLGLRSGLSFDRALEMYHQHFETGLSAEIAAAQQQWTVGLTTREDALRKLAQAYDSALFGRVVANIVRSLRFGASLAESLEASAAESRSVHKAKVEERVAKAPVKMLIPTGTLILPAMLLLVLGPVLLGLIQDF